MLTITDYIKEKSEDTKGVIRSRKSKKDRHYNSQKKIGQEYKQCCTDTI